MKPLDEINPNIYENPQKDQIIEMLRLAGIVNVTADTADELMRGTYVAPKDQAAIMRVLEQWEKAKDKNEKMIIAKELADIVKKGEYLHLAD